MLDAVCFEPGLFHPDLPKPPPTQLPSLARDVFATPCGLLVNELQRSPGPLVGAARSWRALKPKVDARSTPNTRVVFVLCKVSPRTARFVLHRDIDYVYT